MKQINYKSDFDLIATIKAYDTEGNEVEIGFMNYDWEIELYTGCNNYASRNYKVSYIGGKATNCFNDNGKVHIICDNHKMNIGALNGVVKAYIPNAIYPDGHQLIVAPLNFSIELVEDAGDSPTPIDVTISLPYFYDSAYHQAVQGGYQGTQEEYFALASQLPNAVETANKVQESADSLADSAEQIGSAIEILGATTDAIEQGANVIKDNADTLQESATIVKTSAEQIGANIADLQASVQSIDGAVADINSGASAITQSATKVESSATSLSTSATSIAESATSLSGSADKVQQGASAIEGSVGAITNASEVLSEKSEELGTSAEAISNASTALESLASEWVSGRKAIATALTNRKYPTEPSESFHAMADKITNMSYEEGWFAKIGYTDENDGGLKEAIDYSYELAKGWDPDGSTGLIFRENRRLVFAPMVDISKYTSLANMFNGCVALSTIPLLDTSNITSMMNMFYGCSALSIIRPLDTSKVTNMSQTFYNCASLSFIPQLDTRNVTTMQQITRGTNYLIRIEGLYLDKVTAHQFAYGNYSIVFAKFYNLGMSSLVTHDFSQMFNWGTGGEENRQSLIDSLITYSYDRASNGMATATIKLSANTKALLTEEEIAQITQKGYTIA